MSLKTWDAPTGVYTSSIPPGTRAFRAYIAKKFGFTRTEVVRDKSRCNHAKSEHCECAAIDFFTTDVVFGRKVFDFCVKIAEAAGVQSVIFNRRVIGFGDPRERRYTGPSPHTDHVHVGLNRWARNNLTYEMLEMIDDQEEDDEMKPEDWTRLQGMIHKEVGMLAAALLAKDEDTAQEGGSFFDVPRGDSLMDVAIAARNSARKAAQNTATPPAPPAAPIDATDPNPTDPEDPDDG